MKAENSIISSEDETSKATAINISNEKNEISNSEVTKNKQFEAHTKFIKKHFKTVLEVAKRLHIVKTDKLFKVKYKTFEEYVEKEFNYTRSRAYQLIRADEVAQYINNETGEEVIKNEAQCRELLKLKIHSDGAIDEIATNKAQLEIINELKVEKNVTSSAIAKKIREQIKTNKDNESEKKIKNNFNRQIKTFSTVISKIRTNKNIADEIRDEIKNKTIAELKNLLAELEE